MGLARMQAVMRGASVALRFERQSGELRIAVYEDGNLNGVRAADIQAGIDPLLETPFRFFDQFPGVDVGVAPGTPATSAIALGGTDILSFSPAGTATSGTIYLVGPDGTQWAVRVLGATARMRVLRYDPRARTWVAAF